MKIININKLNILDIISIIILIIISTSCISKIIVPIESVSLPPTKSQNYSTSTSLHTQVKTKITASIIPMTPIVETIIPSETDNKLLQDWGRLGPDGGYIDVLVIDPVINTTIYAGSQSDLFKSTDNGMHWINLNPGLEKGRKIMDLEIDPRETNTIYLIDSPSLWTSGNLYKSTDGARRWEKLNINGVNTVKINPLNPNIIYAGCKDGIYKSDDNGNTWKSSTLIFSIGALEIDPSLPSVIYAGIRGGMIYKSIDAGNSWKLIKEGNAVTGFITIAINPNNPDIIYEGTIEGIYKSITGGKEWIQLTKWEEPNWDLLNGILTIIIDPSNNNIIYVGSLHGIFKSIDGGKQWEALKHNIYFPEIHSLVMDNKHPNILLAASQGGGVYKSENNGNNWYTINNGLAGYLPIISIAIDNINSSTIYASTNGLYKSTNNGKDWSLISPYMGGILVIDPINPTTIYQSGYEEKKTKETWNDWGWSIIKKSLNGGGRWSKGYRVAWGSGIATLVIDPKATNILYAGVHGIEETNDIYKSIDSGITWKRLGVNRPIKALAIDPKNTTTLYAAMPLTGYMLKTINGGMTWKEINNGIENNNEILSIAIDPIDTNVIYAGNYKSIDGGDTWKKMGGGGDIIVIDPLNTQILFAGSDSGVIKSIDGGDTWFNIGLSYRIIKSIIIDPQLPSILYVGTESGVYFLNQK
jgi:photosystem II stability/assembly factor-like uncharacterized protein